MFSSTRVSYPLTSSTCTVRAVSSSLTAMSTKLRRRETTLQYSSQSRLRLKIGSDMLRWPALAHLFVWNHVYFAMLFLYCTLFRRNLPKTNVRVLVYLRRKKKSTVCCGQRNFVALFAKAKFVYGTCFVFISS